MASMRTYGDPCGIARALDLVGERWGLLIARELILGPKRFTDLRAGLPTVSPNVLSQRLRELEQGGVVTTRRLPPPAGAVVYELTEWGAELEPVLLALGRWGSRSPARHQRQLSVDALMIALITTFDPALAEGRSLRIGITMGDDQFTLTVADGKLEVSRQEPTQIEGRIRTDVATLRQLVFGNGDLTVLRDTGRVDIEGDQESVAAILSLFTLRPLVELPSG
jgi:DNA-binding HxlR family transcriptional regulator